MRSVITILGIVGLTVTGCGNGYLGTDLTSEGYTAGQEMLPAEASEELLKPQGTSSVDVATYRAAPAGKAIKEQYIVVLKDDYVETEVKRASGMSIKANLKAATPFKVQTVANFTLEMANTYNAYVRHQYHSALAGFAARMTHQEMEYMLEDPRIAFIEQDQTVSLNATQSGATWGLDRIDQPSLPLNGTYNYNYDGSGVDAYIIDTGIRKTHNDFGGRVLNGFTAINDGWGSSDCNGHGTHVAGTVGGSTWGVAKNVTLIPVRVLDCNGSGDYSDIIAGVDWVKQNASGPSVANMSLGGGNSVALDNAVKSAIASGITFVLAAGNDSSNACDGSPNKVPEGLTIASSMSNDQRSVFSNWGSCIDMFAPGSDITSAGNTSDSSTATMGGTSMAAPHVAGVVALYLDQNPSASPAQVESALESAAATNRISDANGSPNLLVQTDLGGGGTPSGYCDSKGQNNSYEWISNVKIGTFSNSSGASNYSNFTSQVINLEKGESYSVTLTPGFAGSSYAEYFTIWIDFNGDEDFDDSGEQIFSQSGSSAVSGTINIPSSFAANSTRMRISMKYGGFSDPCETFSYGEVEDYTVSFGAGGGESDGLLVGSVSINQSSASYWKAVSFGKVFSEVPIVVMGPASYRGGDPSTVRVRNVTTSGFEFQLDEWDYRDGSHTTETISYLVVLPGSHQWGGMQVQAGEISAVNHNFQTVTYETGFANTPVVLAQQVTNNDGQATCVRIKSSTTAGFAVRLQEEENNDGSHTNEKVHYVAFQTGTTLENGIKIRAFLTPNAVTENWYYLDFGYAMNNPFFLANMQTYDGSDPATVRYTNLDDYGVQVKVEEEKSRDTEVRHANEIIGWVVLTDVTADNSGSEVIWY